LAFSGIMFGLSVISLPALPMVVAYATTATGVVAGLVYLWHSRRVRYPILDLRILRHPVFRTTVIAGSLFRVSVGAMPFLMPLMLQLGFGLSPFQSGLITFAGGVGALISKLFAERIYASFGFKRVLAVAVLVGSFTLWVNGFFFPDTPYVFILGSLLVGGLMRSVFFTGAHALGYEDISDQEASQATAISAVIQQLSISLGVAVAGATLELSTGLHGGPVTMSDFHLAWWVVAGISLLALIPLLRLRSDTGSSISGHKARSRVPNTPPE